MTELDWILAAQQGDRDSFACLVQSYEQRVYQLALRMCGNSEDAQDAAQEAFLSAWRGLPGFRREASFSTWLFRLTSNACIDLLRRQKKNASALSLEESGEDLTSPTLRYQPETALEQQLLREGIVNGLQQLPPECRQVLVLRELEQLSYGEIARLLALEEGTVKSRIHRGRKLLRKYLIDNGNFFAPSASKNSESNRRGGAIR